MPDKTEQFELEQYAPPSGSPPAYSTIQTLPGSSSEAVAPPADTGDNENNRPAMPVAQPAEMQERVEPIGDGDTDAAEDSPEKQSRSVTVLDVLSVVVVLIICLGLMFAIIGAPIICHNGTAASSSASSSNYASVSSISPTTIN